MWVNTQSTMEAVLPHTSMGLLVMNLVAGGREGVWVNTQSTMEAVLPQTSMGLWVMNLAGVQGEGGAGMG